MRIKGGTPVTAPSLGDGIAETPEEEAFFEGVTRTQAPAPRPVQTGSVLGKQSLLSVQVNAFSPLKDFASARFQRLLDDETDSVATQGNTVMPLFDGVNSFAERDRLIDSAQHSIFLQTFIFNSDETGWALANKLAEKARAGVKVCVIYDSVGTGRADPRMMQMMRDAGVEVREYGPKSEFWKLNNRWHEKLLIVDGGAAITGGMNIANEYAWGGTDKKVLSRGNTPEEAWRDTDVRVGGPIVRPMLLDFMYNWSQLGPAFTDEQETEILTHVRPPEAGGVQARFITRKELETKDDTGINAYYYAITAAQKSITIENAYFAPPPEIREALLDAVKRGVKVRVLTNSAQSNDLTLIQDVMRYWQDELIAGGVEIYEKKGGTLHAKTATFDGVFSYIGSMNLNQRSTALDTEDVIAINDSKTAAALEQRFDSDVEAFHKITLAELRNEGPLTNARQWAVKTLFGSFT